MFRRPCWTSPSSRSGPASPSEPRRRRFGFAVGDPAELVLVEGDRVGPPPLQHGYPPRPRGRGRAAAGLSQRAAVVNVRRRPVGRVPDGPAVQMPYCAPPAAGPSRRRPPGPVKLLVLFPSRPDRHGRGSGLVPCVSGAGSWPARRRSGRPRQRSRRYVQRPGRTDTSFRRA
jgi:hypothetical protein